MQSMREQAERLFWSGNVARAGELFLALALQSPDDVMLRLRHAECARQAGNTLAAVASFRSAAALFASFGDPSRARKALRVALALSPDHPELTRELAALQPKGAKPAFELAIEVAPSQPLVIEVLDLPEPGKPELRRIDAQTVAFRRADGQGWFLVHAESALHVHEVQLEGDEPELEILEELPAD